MSKFPQSVILIPALETIIRSRALVALELPALVFSESFMLDCIIGLMWNDWMYMDGENIPLSFGVSRGELIPRIV
jgi:hypothetical protein